MALRRAADDPGRVAVGEGIETADLGHGIQERHAGPVEQARRADHPAQDTNPLVGHPYGVGDGNGDGDLRVFQKGPQPLLDEPGQLLRGQAVGGQVLDQGNGKPAVGAHRDLARELGLVPDRDFQAIARSDEIERFLRRAGGPERGDEKDKGGEAGPPQGAAPGGSDPGP